MKYLYNEIQLILKLDLAKAMLSHWHILVAAGCLLICININYFDGCEM
jgi:hypothetical protein